MATVASALSGGSGPVADQLAEAAEILRRSTVHVRVGQMGGGSGVIWQPDGLIITNAHVARQPRAEVELWDGRKFDAELTAHNPERDLAALRIEASDLPAAPIGDSDALRVGQLVAAVGNPLGLSGALTLGIIHAVAPSEGRGRQSWVQADVHLAPGNSGGPLADVEGRVIGINSMVAGGLGLAVPSNAVGRFLGTGGVRPRLGVTMQPVVIPGGNGTTIDGLLVLEVTPQSPAERAGLSVGDIVVGANGQRFGGPYALPEAIDAAARGSALRLDIVTGGAPRSVTVSLAAGNVTPEREAA